MAGTVEPAGYWLPSEFFDDTLADKLNHAVDSDSGSCFPTEFPYHFERFKDKRRVMSTSPQLALSGRFVSSPNGVAPPPVDAAKLNLSSGHAPRPDKISGPTKRPEQLYHPDPSAFRNIYQGEQGCGMWYGEPQLGPGWPVLPRPARSGSLGSRVISFGASGGGSAGTGVFLPRRYGRNIKSDSSNNVCSSDSRKGPGYAPAYVPERNLRALNQPDFNPEYEMLMARRNALMLQHKRSLLLRSSRLNRGVCLPHDWTY